MKKQHFPNESGVITINGHSMSWTMKRCRTASAFGLRGSRIIWIELKKDSTPEEAIAQIRNRDYMAKILQHTEDILLVGINYDTKTKLHTCKIEKA